MKLLIIGNGIAGNSVADKVRELAGGVEITILADENKPLYSPCLLPYYLSDKISEKDVYLKNLDDYHKKNITFIGGKKVQQVLVDKKQVIAQNEAYRYDKLVLATGSVPVFPQIQGNDLKGVFVFKNFIDAQKIKAYCKTEDVKKAVVVGSGPVGVEAAVSLRKVGYKVYLIELREHILPTILDKIPSDIVKKELENQGVEVLTGERVIDLSGEKKVKAVITDKQKIDCDMVILSVGMKPNTSLAESAGIKTGKTGGIKVDQCMQTNIADIYACGDCIQARDMISGINFTSMAQC